MPVNDHLANLLGALAVGISDRAAAAACERTNLDPSAVAAVLTIAERPGRTVEHLRATLGLTHSGAVRLVSRLEDAGLARRLAGPDRRSRAVEPTAAGRQVADSARRARLDVLREVLDVHDDRAPSPLAETLAGLLRALPANRADAWHICRMCDHDVCQQQGCPVDAAIR